MVANNNVAVVDPCKSIRFFMDSWTVFLIWNSWCLCTLNLMQPTCFFLVVVIPCSTGGWNGICEVTMYSNITAPIVIALCMVECVVGQVQHGNEWGII